MKKQYTISGNEGLTLIELMIAMALFVTMMVVVTSLFGQSVDNQRKTTSQKNLHEGMNYALNLLKSEVAGAKESLEIGDTSTYCGGASNSDKFFYTPTRTFLGNTVKDLYFINKNEQCVRYFLQVDDKGVTRLAITRNGLPVFPSSVYLTASDSTMLDFDVDMIVLESDSDYTSAKLTLFLAAKPVDGIQDETLYLQTTVALTPFICGQTIYDRDSFSYKTVLVGDQCWMAENLKTKTKPNGACINSGASFIAPQCTKTVSNIVYGGENGSGRDCIKSDNTRGTEADCVAGYALYEWDAAMNGSESFNGVNKVQGICPVGWHIPSKSEFIALLTAVGGASNAAPPLKLGGDSGFNGLYVGYRDIPGTGFFSYNEYDNFWVSEEYDNAESFYYYGEAGLNGIVEDFAEKSYSLSVRCLKD